MHETSMADIGGLRQACGSGGVHVEGSVFGSRQPALRLAQRFATILVEVAINAPEGSVGIMGAMNPDCGRRREIRDGSSQTIDQLCGSNHMPGLDDIDAVGQGGTLQIGIKQCNRAAHFGNAKPGSEVFGPVRHEKTNGVALGQLLIERPLGILVRSFSKGAIGEAFAVGEQSSCFAIFHGEFLDHHGQGAAGVAGDGCGQFERTQPGSGTLALGLRWTLRIGRIHAVLPASTVSTVPVMLLALSLRRNSTASATSSRPVRRQSALRRIICWRWPSPKPWGLSVSTKPEPTVFTLTPMRPTSRANERVKPSSEALVAP